MRLSELAKLKSIPAARAFTAHCSGCGLELLGVMLHNFDEQEREFFCGDCRAGSIWDSDEARAERRADLFLAVAQHVRTLRQARALQEKTARGVTHAGA